MNDIRETMQEMITRLNEAADAYYNGQGEKMTDYEWDALFDQLKKLEEESGITLPDSPTQNVSADDIQGQKEPHEFPALSLAKTKKVADLVKWAEGREIWLSWKMDGLTLCATYDNGKLTRVLTRGDGHRGTNITHLSKGIIGIPETIPYKGHLVVRGEAVISYPDFEEFNLESEEEYANPRNLAAGSLTLKDLEELKKRHIHWIPFTLVYCDDEILSWGGRMAFLEEQGMNTVDREKITVPDEAHLTRSIENWTRKVTERIYPYPVDGLVIAYDDTAYAATGSVTGHHATRAGYAFKWQDEAAESVLTQIEWSCAASTITPVAIFEPVALEGTSVKRASLCNISECERLGIGSAGSKISVIKANKIIPKVIKVSEKAGELVIPDTCPVCGAPTKIAVSEVSGTKTLKCTNPICPAKELKKFKRFVSKAGMDIDGVSEMTLRTFVDKGWVKEYADIYKLSEHIDEIRELEGFGDKSAENIAKAIEKARNVDAAKFLFALNIPLVGPDVAKRLLGAYPLKELVETAETTLDAEIFAGVDGIGPEKSSSFVEWFKDERNAGIYDRLLQEITVQESEKTETGNKVQGLTFVVTGDVHIFKNRNELKAYIESEGGKVTGSVSKSTSFLINNDLTSTSSKNTKAKQLNIPIISEDDFVERFGKGE